MGQGLGRGALLHGAASQRRSFAYRGRDVEADVSYAFGYLGDMMIQFIEQHDDKPSIYRDMYTNGEEGFHHVAYLVSDFAGERQRWLDMGYEIATGSMPTRSTPPISTPARSMAASPRSTAIRRT